MVESTVLVAVMVVISRSLVTAASLSLSPPVVMSGSPVVDSGRSGGT